MEFVLGAISLTSLVLNYLIYKRITATYVVGSVEDFDLATSHLCQCVAVEEKEPEPVVETSPPVKDTVAYSAWKNQKDIPWVPPVKAPEPIVKAPNRGPLARPDGFV